MLIPHDWDKGDPLSEGPPFLPEDVERLLGVHGTPRQEWRKSERSQVNHRYTTVTFDCGCVAYEARGWAPCNGTLHQLLANHFGERQSNIIDRFAELKARFDRVLRESWLRFRPDEEDAPGARSNDRATFRALHDIGGVPVWHGDSLKAELDFVPGERSLVLYNAGTFQAPDLVLELESRVAPRAAFNDYGVADAMSMSEERLLELAFPKNAAEVDKD